MTQSQQIIPGSRVTLHFSLSLEDGTVADTTRDEGEPFEFTLGDGSMIPGLELALMGLKEGDTQCLRISSEVAFGDRAPDNVHWMPRSEFAADLHLEPGVVIGFSMPSGEEIPGTILELNDEQVMLDFNHPLAGHELTFDVEIIAVEPPAAHQQTD